MRLIGAAAICVLAIASGYARSSPREAIEVREAQLACITMNTERLPLDSRRSPLDSLTFSVEGKPVKICYSRPAARDREIFGGLVAYDRLWRTGANEPTMIHTTSALDIAGIRVEPGSYSLYTIPGESEWQIIVNRSIDQWGHEGRYTAEVRAQEVGRARVKSDQAADFVESFTIRSTPAAGGSVNVILEWERTRVGLPISAAKG